MTLRPLSRLNSWVGCGSAAKTVSGMQSAPKSKAARWAIIFIEGVFTIKRHFALALGARQARRGMQAMVMSSATPAVAQYGAVTASIDRSCAAKGAIQ